MGETRSLTVTAPKCKEKFGAERQVQFNRAFGGDLDGAVKEFGADVVFDIFSQQAAVKCAATVRARLEAADEAGKPKYSDAEAIAAGMEYVPSSGPVRKPKDPFASLLADIASGKITKAEAIKTINARLAEAGAEA